MTPQELRAIRERLGLSQEALADALYVSQPAVAQWESGEVRITERRARQIRDTVRRIEKEGAGAS